MPHNNGLKKEDIEKRVMEIPQLISKLTEEYNQLLGYLKCLRDIEGPEDKIKDKEKK
tara:strand:+ start:1548 stop:1718 length:171 start_codon:yes stop_codon:yes gene_type:complete